MPVKRFRTGALMAAVIAGCTGLSDAPEARAIGFEILKPHRAVYEVKLDKASERSGIATMSGRIAYEITGNACDGIAVNYRFVSRVNANGDIFTTDQQTATHETPDGRQYTFVTKSYVNERLDRTVKGVATSDGSTTHVSLDEPEPRELDLGKAFFVSGHLVEVIRNAGEGVPFVSVPVFDGGDEADEVLKTTNVIGRPQIAGEAFPGEDPGQRPRS